MTTISKLTTYLHAISRLADGVETEEAIKREVRMALALIEKGEKK